MVDNVYLYARVSSERQRHNNSLRRQILYGRQLAETLEATELIREEIREVSSAYKVQPPLLADLITRALPNSLIIIYRYDRFSRNPDYGFPWLDQLTQNNIGVVEVPYGEEPLLSSVHADGRAYAEEQIRHAHYESYRKEVEINRIRESKLLWPDEIIDSDYENDPEQSGADDSDSDSDSDPPTSSESEYQPEEDEDMDDVR